MINGELLNNGVDFEVKVEGITMMGLRMGA